ncbi:hypothetical protein VTN49DRAFT_5196 [Thermomyces lanuginosus]|uniref:uncharacterized protein n=1 Tax=Thermomyces lanuginosus TaxID=5541 RepID=UPI0037432329
MGSLFSQFSSAQITAATALGLAIVACLHKLFSPWVELPHLPEKWISFRGGLAWILFKNDVRFTQDVVLDHERGVAIISLDPSRISWQPLHELTAGNERKGRLLLYYYAMTGRLQELELVGFPDAFELHPRGINIFRAPNNSLTRLFVVNHGGFASTVEVMDVDYEKAQAVYVASISDGGHLIISANAVAPVSYDSFYVTNDHYLIRRKHPILPYSKTTWSFPLGWVTFVNFASQDRPVFTIVAGGIPFANGILVTPTGKEVLVASANTNDIRIYNRDPETNALSSRYDNVHVTFHPDNLSFDHSLDLNDQTVFDRQGKFLRGVIAAGCPDAGRMFCMAQSPQGCVAPSVVAEIRRGCGPDPSPFPASFFKPGSKYHARTLYADDGDHYPSSTTGDMDSKRGRLIVSGLYANGLLDITWDPREHPNY